MNIDHPWHNLLRAFRDKTFHQWAFQTRQENECLHNKVEVANEYMGFCVRDHKYSRHELVQSLVGKASNATLSLATAAK